MNKIGSAGIPLNVVMKDTDIQFLDVVDKVLLGNKWLRKAFGIQPKFPYVVDSFEERCRCNCLCLVSLFHNSCLLDCVGRLTY